MRESGRQSADTPPALWESPKNVHSPFSPLPEIYPQKPGREFLENIGTHSCRHSCAAGPTKKRTHSGRFVLGELRRRPWRQSSRCPKALPEASWLPVGDTTRPCRVNLPPLLCPKEPPSNRSSEWRVDYGRIWSACDESTISRVMTYRRVHTSDKFSEHTI